MILAPRPRPKKYNVFTVHENQTQKRIERHPDVRQHKAARI